MAAAEELTDEECLTVEALLPELPRRSDGRGRPWRSQREVRGGVWRILRSGARWKDLPGCFPPYQTCHRRYQTWVESGALRDVLEVLAEDWHERGQIDLSGCLIDGTFIVAKKGGRPWVPPSGAKARNSWQWQTLLVFLSPSTQRVLARLKSPLSRQLWRRVSWLKHPHAWSATKPTNSDPLDAQLAAQDVRMITPHRRGRKRPKTQDGRVLRRCRRRWKSERLLAWQQNFRRILTRHERKSENYLGFVHLGCSKILLRQYL